MVIKSFDMKKILYILTALLILAGCGKEGGEEDKAQLDKLICGEWHSTSLSVKADIYLSFTEDKKFEMYQQIGQGAYRLYRGTWNVEEDILTGKYNDGENWAASYTLEIEGTKMTMTSKNDAEEVSRYEKKSIPEEVKAGCEIVVKSAEAGL